MKAGHEAMRPGHEAMKAGHEAMKAGHEAMTTTISVAGLESFKHHGLR
jgi:hypothetical protein